MKWNKVVIEIEFINLVMKPRAIANRDELLRVRIRFHPHPHPDQNSHHDVTCIPRSTPDPHSTLEH